MNSNNTKCQLAENARVNYSRGMNLARDVRRAVSQMKIDENFWNVTWKGLTFSVRPFLCSGLCFVKSIDMFNVVVDLILRYSDDFYDKLVNLSSDEYYGTFTEDEDNMYYSIMFQTHSQVPCVTRYLIGTGNNDAFKKIVTYLLKELLLVCEEKGMHIDFKDKTLCNTEAFSYYISMYWALQKSKKVQMLLLKDVKTLNITKILDTLCPEESLHYKVLSGVLPSKELARLYSLVTKEDIPIAAREVAELLEFVSDDTIKFSKDVLDGLDFCVEYESFVRIMGSSFITGGAYVALKDYFNNSNNLISLVKDDNEKLTNTNRDLRNQIKDLKRDLASLEEKLENQVKENDIDTYKSKIQALTDKVKALKKENISLTDTISVRDKTILQQKQVISSQIKEIKSLNASLDKCSCKASENKDVSDNIEVEKTSIPDMVDKLKSFKIAIFGGYDSRNLEQKFNTYGLEIKQYISNSSFTIGSLDCAVILTSNITHHSVRNLESQFDGKILYFNGTNVELIINELYKLLCMEV